MKSASDRLGCIWLQSNFCLYNVLIVVLLSFPTPKIIIQLNCTKFVLLKLEQRPFLTSTLFFFSQQGPDKKNVCSLGQSLPLGKPAASLSTFENPEQAHRVGGAVDLSTHAHIRVAHLHGAEATLCDQPPSHSTSFLSPVLSCLTSIQ